MQIQVLHELGFRNLKRRLHYKKSLASGIIDDTPLDLSSITHLAGVDVSVKNNVSQAAVVVMTYPDCEPVETVRSKLPTPYPYIPGTAGPSVRVRY